jgi:hypothetical protein
MGTLIAAYLIACAAVTTYVAWLAIQNHRLAQRLESEVRSQRSEVRRGDA